MRCILLLCCLLPLSLQAQNGEKWRPLFNGKNLKGWEAKGDFDAFVESAEIVLQGRSAERGSWLMSEKQYENAEVEAEYLLPPPASSGFCMRMGNPDQGDPAVSGYVIQLQNEADILEPSGTIQGLARAKWVESTKPDDWNRLRIRAEGDHLRVWINDELVAEVHDRRSLSGRLGLQAAVEGIRWRNLRVRELTETAFLGPQIEDYARHTRRRKPVSLFDGQTLSGWQVEGDARWLVLDGAIVGDTGPEGDGFLLSEKAWQNFYLSYKFHIQDGHNSGVFIRRDTTASETSLENSLEVNVYDPGTLAWGYPTGGIVTHVRAFPGITDSDDWNLMEIFAFGNHICIYVNGQKTSEIHVPDAFVQPGHICLQAGRQVATEEKGPSQVRYKDIEIKDLDGIPFLGY